MTKEENLHWLNQEIRTWENECQSKHPIKEALHAARKALEQEPILEKDGTLIATTEHYENVGRVLVQYGTNGALFYQDREPTTKNNLRVDWESYKDVDGNSLDDLILEVLQNNFDCGNTYGYKVADEIIGLLPSVTPQEQDKPMVEIDLYSVIKQKYIEREVLDEIRAEIEKQVLESLSDGGDDWFTAEKVNECLDIIDKYKAESENT